MKLLIDCTSLKGWSGTPSGIQRVIAELARSSKNMMPASQCVAFNAAKHAQIYDVEKSELGQVVSISAGDVIFTAGANWDILDHHSNLIELQSRGCRVVPLLYDVIPLVLPHSFGPGFSQIYRKWFEETLSYAELAFSISRSTSEDIFNWAKNAAINFPDIYTIRLGDNLPIFAPKPSQMTKDIETPFILCVGTIEYRKNHRTLLDAYRYLIDHHKYDVPLLVIVGRQGWLDYEIEHQIKYDPRLAGKVIVLSGLSDDDLAHLYQHAQMTVFPSLYEGWGLPISESLAYGTPCIASGTSSMREIDPNLVIHIPPLDTIGWAEAIKHLCENNVDREQLQKKIKTKYKATKWDDTAVQIFEILKYRFPEIADENLF
jgi:glycosyltransferase involved in cell wall biosynthesis